MPNDKSYFKLIEWQNILYPIANRKKGNTKIDECPYCGREHSHGFGAGHRLAHCKDNSFFKEIKIKGNIISQDRGYFIEEY